MPASRLLFLTIFLDLVGFSIIFPLFPAMLQFYLERESAHSGLFSSLFPLLESLAGGDTFRVTVLFGALLGSLFSLLQFLFAPLWGALSDRLGRRPVLLCTVAGTGLSYALWAVSSSFSMLLLSRLLGGIMAGNLSVATAAVADTTTREKRASGMALIGVAFSLGFILGPLLGGLGYHWQPPQATDPGFLGLHPFSGPALLALLLSLLNFLWVCFRLPETLDPAHRRTEPRRHSIARLFAADPPPARLAIRLFFLLILGFSGMEFTLTFLAVQRFAYTPTQNGFMFLYIGFLLALIQGGLVRRLAPRVGERPLVSAGLVAGTCGLLLLAFGGSSQVLFFLGLAGMAGAIGLASPSLQSLVSLYTPPERQGLNLGLLRGAGSLARVFGPLLAGYLYFQFGPAPTYLAGAALLLLPLFLAPRLPAPSPA